MIIDGSTLDPTAAYKLLIGSIVPRAIGWVSTLSTDGVANLAPISFFTAVGRQPPMVSLSMQGSKTNTLLPDLRSVWAIVNPMPLAAPVTTATDGVVNMFFSPH
jgi:hypothetical protein